MRELDRSSGNCIINAALRRQRGTVANMTAGNVQEQTETKPAQPCSAASPIRQLPHWKVIPLLILLRLPAKSSSCLVTFLSVPTGLFTFLEVVHNSRKDKVEGEGEQVLSVQPHIMTEAPSLFLPSPQVQHTDSPDDTLINTASTAETGQCAVP